VDAWSRRAQRLRLHCCNLVATLLLPRCGRYVAKLNSNTALFATLQRIIDSPMFSSLNNEQQRMAASLATEFERDGIHLSDQGA
jgi:Zn-dependent oligopeptidase